MHKGLRVTKQFAEMTSSAPDTVIIQQVSFQAVR